MNKNNTGRLEQSRIALNKEPIFVETLIAYLAANYQPVIEQKNIRFSLDG